VEAAADELQNDDIPLRRSRLVASLSLLADHLLTHLEFEEESIAPTLRTMEYLARLLSARIWEPARRQQDAGLRLELPMNGQVTRCA
jgi:hypothetical protein